MDVRLLAVAALLVSAGCLSIAGLEGDYALGGAAGSGDPGATATGGGGGHSSSASAGGAQAGGGGPDGGSAGSGDHVAPCDEDGIVVCYSFEGDLLDGSLGQHHATASNVSYTGGVDGQALHHQVGSMVEAPAAPFALSELTLELWVRPQSLPDDERTALVDHAGRYGMFLLAGGIVQCRAGELVSGSAIQVNRWTHIACTFTSSQIAIYLDGHLDVAEANSGLVSTPSTVRIGSNYPSGQELVGELDGFRLFDRLRSAREICESAGQTGCP